LLDGFGQNELMDETLFLKVRPGDAVLYEKDQIGKVLTIVAALVILMHPHSFKLPT